MRWQSIAHLCSCIAVVARTLANMSAAVKPAFVCRAGIRQPSVEVRFDKLTASGAAPAGSSEGLFTVGVDLQVRSLVLHAAHALKISKVFQKGPVASLSQRCPIGCALQCLRAVWFAILPI